MGTGPARATLRTDTTEGSLPYVAWIHVNTMPPPRFRNHQKKTEGTKDDQVLVVKYHMRPLNWMS